MSLPASIPPGYVSIYGSASIQGITADSKYQFGIVDAALMGSGAYSVGQSVLFRIDETVRVNHDNTQYFLLPETNIILTEDPIIPPP